VVHIDGFLNGFLNTKNPVCVILVRGVESVADGVESVADGVESAIIVNY